VTLNELIQQLVEGPLRLTAPSLVSASGTTLYMQRPPALQMATKANLDRPLSDLIRNGDEVTVTDPLLESINVTIAISFEG
jgi:NEDD8-activating enzyme E1